MSERSLSTRIERWPARYTFRISGYEMNDFEVLVAEIGSDGIVGRGEAQGVYYRETVEGCRADIDGIGERLRQGAGRQELLDLLPPGGARNALDCALWDFEAKRAQRSVWDLVGLHGVKPITTTYTLGADEPQVMAQRALAFRHARAIKVKLTGTHEDAERVRAIRAARPDVWLGVDGNQGFTPLRLAELMPVLIEANVELIEQPFPAGRDADMEGLASPIPFAADESAQDLGDLPRLVGRFGAVNIKLDKCGGLTQGLVMHAAARRLGLKSMVGCMGGTSLAMAPAFVLAQFCDIVDLDGPLVLEHDRLPAALYDDSGHVFCPSELWGGPTPIAYAESTRRSGT